MKYITVLSPTDSDAATLAASSQVATLPVANLQNMQPKRKWRSGGVTESITIDLGAAVACNGFALIGHNFTSAATIRVRGKATADVTVSPAVDTTAVSAWPASGKPSITRWPQWLSWVSWANETALRYWRVDIADAGNADGYLQAGRLMLGRYWRPSDNFDLGGSPLSFDTKDVQTIGDFGDTFTDRRGSSSAARKFSLQIIAADKDDVLDGIAEIQRLRGMWGDVVMLLDPDADARFHTHSAQVLFTTPQAHSIAPYFTGNGETWSVNFESREVI